MSLIKTIYVERDNWINWTIQRRNLEECEKYHTCVYMYESRAIKIFPQLFKIKMLVYTWNTRISVNIVTQLAVQHSRFREFSDGYREIFRAVFLLFLCIFFSHRGKLSKGCISIHPTLRFPVGVPINRRESYRHFKPVT